MSSRPRETYRRDVAPFASGELDLTVGEVDDPVDEPQTETAVWEK